MAAARPGLVPGARLRPGKDTMLRHLSIAGALALVSALVPAQEAAPTWFADFDAAAAAAKEAKKDLLVDFTGSDWCGWCIKLHKEVFDHQAFTSEAGKQFVFVALDFPNSEELKAKVPNPARNQELMQKYGVQGFPTILLMTPEGEAYARTGYRPGGPEKYVAHLKEESERGRATLAGIAEISQKLKSADATGKAALVGKAIDLLGKQTGDSPFVEPLSEIAREALALDPENKAGLRNRALIALLGAGVSDDEIASAARNADPKNELGLLEKVALQAFAHVDSDEKVHAALKALTDLEEAGPIKDDQTAIQMYANAAFWNHRILQNTEAARGYAEKLKARNPDNPRIKALIQEILGS
jgi:thioredoxin-related protein